jgi:redox-sensing transcriptional repressor
LLYFQEEGKEVISSQDIAYALKISPHKVRKDLSYFGHFGRKGIGYSCNKLIGKIRGILGLDKKWYACLVGFGNLGRALSFYKGFKDQGIVIKLAFEIDKKKINKTYSYLKVYSVEKMENILRKEKIDIGIITVPKRVAEEIAQRLYKCGIRAILNFAPLNLDLPSDCILKDVDLSCNLSYLTYRLKLLDRERLKVSYKNNIF